MKVFLTNYIQHWRRYAKEPGRRVLVLGPVERKKEIGRALSQQSSIMVALDISSEKRIQPLIERVETVWLTDEMPMSTLNELIMGTRGSDRAGKVSTNEKSTLLCGFLIEIRQSIDLRILEIALEELIRLLPCDFFLSGLACQDAQTHYLTFTDKRERRALSKTQKEIALALGWPGYGDAVMMFQSIQRLIDRERAKGYCVHIIVNHKEPYHFLREFLRDCQVILMMIHPTHYLFEALLQSGQYERVYQNSVLWFENITPHHATEIWTRSLGTTEVPLFLDRSQVLISTMPQHVQYKLKELRSQGSPLIGFQFHTGDKMRSWPTEHARKFAELCTAKGYIVLNLTPHPHMEITELTVDVSFLQVTEMVQLIAHLDAVVGIDSCCGHIAGVLGIPNLTLWGLNYPYASNPLGEETCYVGFRPVRMNYSLVPKNTDSTNVSPELAFSRLIDILDGEIQLKDERITTEETMKGLWIEWVG